jgi:hypothetical protein
MARGAQTQPVVDVTLNFELPPTQPAAALYVLTQAVSAGRNAELCRQAREFDMGLERFRSLGLEPSARRPRHGVFHPYDAQR